MGVVYKLKQEIIDYIINEKKVDSNLSCRKLVNIVNQRFQINCSKSSINAIIQKANLSSPVGRRAIGEKKPSKFGIPSHKRAELFIPAPQELLDDSVPREPLPTPRIQEQPRVDTRYPALGLFFLKAAEWELSDSSILGGILKKYINEPLELDLNVTSEILLYLKALGLNSLEEIQKYSLPAISILNGIKENVQSSVIEHSLRKIIHIDFSQLDLISQVLQYFIDINTFKFELEDKSEFYIDAEQNTIWEKNVHSSQCFSISVNKSIKIVSENYINNVQSIILRFAPGEKNFSSLFYNMIASFENMPGKRIIKISCHEDSTNDEIAQFTVLPNQKRAFIIGAWHEQNEFTQFCELAKSQPVKHIFLKYIHKDLYFKEISNFNLQNPIDGKQLPMRVILLQESEHQSPMIALLANEAHLSSLEVISAYLTRWPNLRTGYEEFLESSRFPPEKGGVSVSRDWLCVGENSLDFFNTIEILLLNIHRYCQKHFFPDSCRKLDLTEMRLRFYNLPGYLKEESKFLIVNLSLSEKSSSYRQELAYAARRINEREIISWNGKKLIVNLIE